MKGFHSQSCMILWLRRLARLYDKLKPLHLHYHNVYGHQTWQCHDLHLKSHDPLVKECCEITCQTKAVIYPLLEFLWSSNMAEW